MEGGWARLPALLWPWHLVKKCAKKEIWEAKNVVQDEKVLLQGPYVLSGHTQSLFRAVVKGTILKSIRENHRGSSKHRKASRIFLQLQSLQLNPLILTLL